MFLSGLARIKSEYYGFVAKSKLHWAKKTREAEVNITIAFLLILNHKLAQMETQGCSSAEEPCMVRTTSLLPRLIHTA